MPDSRPLRIVGPPSNRTEKPKRGHQVSNPNSSAAPCFAARDGVTCDLEKVHRDPYAELLRR